MELKLICEIIWRRKWIVIGSFLIIFLTTVIGTSFLTPVYQSTAKIQIKKSTSESYLLSNIGLADKAATPQATETDILNHIEIATSTPVIEKLIQRLQLTDKKGQLQTPMMTLKSKFLISSIFPEPYIEVETIDDTDMIEITATSSDPEESAMMVNTLAEICIEENINSKREELLNAETHTKNQIEIIESKYLRLGEQLLKYKSEQNIVDLETESKEAISTLAKMMEKKENNLLNISETKAKIKSLATQLKMQDPDKISSNTINENSYIKKLTTGIFDLELDLAEILTEKTMSHPDAIIIDMKLSKLKDELKNEIILNNSFASGLQSLERELAGAIASQSSLDAEIQKFLVSYYALPEKKMGDDQLAIDFKINQSLYSKLLEFLSQIKTVGPMIRADIKLIEKARVPDINKPSSPSLLLNSIIATLLSILFGLGLAFLVDYIDTSMEVTE